MNINISQSAASTDVNPASLLHRLKEAHADLLGAIDDLEQLTSGRVPTEIVLTSARWKISKASLTRRLLWGRIHAHLSASANRYAQDILRHLQKDDIHLLRLSTSHIGKWSTEAVFNDWPGYCKASELMRRAMIGGIEGEKRKLYPLLEEHRAARQSRDPAMCAAGSIVSA